MRIDGTQGIGPQGLPEHKTSGSTKQAGQASQADGGVPQLQREQKDLIARAQAAPEVRADAVEAARAALLAGQLDSPEAILRTAQAIIDQGV